MTRGPKKQFDTDMALQQAMHVFWEHGYEAASLSELLRRMGIGKKSLYDTFGNKQSLFFKALEHYAQTNLSQMRDRLLATGSVLENLRGLLEDWQVLHSTPGSCGCMIGTNIADFNTEDEAIAKVMRFYLQQTEDLFCEALSRAQLAGEISPHISPRNLAQLLLCSTHGIALLGRVMVDQTTIQGSIQALLALM